MIVFIAASAASDQTCTTNDPTSSLHQLFNVPVWTAGLSLGSSALAELERLVLAKHAVVRNAAVYDAGDRGAVANNNFFGMQHADEAAWIEARDRCLFAAGSGPVGSAAATCEATADASSPWAELRTSAAYRALRDAIRAEAVRFLEAARVRRFRPSPNETCSSSSLTDMRCWELSADGNEVVWIWVTVHADGVRHPAHDHPQSLASGTFYVSTPPGSGRLVLLDPRRDVPQAWAADDTFDPSDPKSGRHADAGAFSTHVALQPRPGLLVLFPPWLRHYVEPTPAPVDAPRVAFSFNVGGSWAQFARSTVVDGAGPAVPFELMEDSGLGV